ncbi:nucleoside-diphosphate sugar epimerase/dehydratase [Rhodanobacter sp. DHB23]|uniref:polysaccharide biosynthesis protein n=1 Tax=Rhodanobacter sp. DHB23 TaxID=2775923 RepID=UPI0017819EBF|nr:nucleoside-diphosphate sugar epimerase/dehydratase [Rhodanobacter sp. DHB23]MBD8873756.1 polysaccharide biosynthesis protein [Rhodanobacter sp. DHB23]
MPSRRFVAILHPRMAVVLHDLAMAVIAWWVAKLLRYALRPQDVMQFLWFEFPVVLLAQGLIFRWTGLYKGVWRFASVRDLWNILRASLLGSVAIWLLMSMFNRLEGVPRSMLLLYPVMLALLLGVPRLAYRGWKDNHLGVSGTGLTRRVLILGADYAGEVLSRDLLRNGGYAVVGFLDDRPALRGASINGHPVLGRFEQLPAIARETAAEMILIALPSATAGQMRRVVALCDAAGLPYRTVPKLDDVVAGRAQPGEIKEVAIEDLLGRDAIELDWTAIRETIGGRRVLVTGGGGSIGSELCRQVARLGALSLVVVDHSEYNLYQITRELRASYPELLLEAVLASCVDSVQMRKVLAGARPQVVFHAAAYKHVPMLQQQLRAAFLNNVLGTRTMADLSREVGVECFVLISTDKAVNPTSVMGACKRIAEIWCQNLDAQADTRFMTVRFGNVLDSAGSVVPLFRQQIRDGGPVTVTHPEVSRYFMTIPEACQLILQAASLGKGGEIFALDMGEPMKIRDLAEQMIRLAGKKPGSEVPIVFTGLRAGEKLFEELFHPLEQYSATTHAKIFLAQHRQVPWELLQATMHRAADMVATDNDEELRRCVSGMLPSFRWSEAPQPDNVVSIRRHETGEK